MKLLLCSLLFFISTNLSFAQKYIIKGQIQDKVTKENLSYANVRLAGTARGTSANIEGNFELRLDEGTYTLIASFIGYKSDTAAVNLKSTSIVNFILTPITIELGEVTVLPGRNPADEIIQKTIAAKHERDRKLNSYIFDSYTKGMIKTTKDIIANDNSIGVDIGERDTANLKITGILENQNRGYFKKPDYYKDEIIARKQSANAPATINILTGGRVLQNFCSDDIEFFGRPLPSPIADNALDYYYYILEDKLAMDNLNIFQISFQPIDDSDPGFEGKIYIADSIFNLMKVDIGLNRAANPGGLFDNINVFQQFMPYEDNIYMPIDYRLYADGNFLGIAKFGFELQSIFYNYEINPIIDDDVFGMAIVKVLSDADEKDFVYWNNIERIPNTNEEILAYKRIDSLSSIPRSFWDDFSILSSRINFSNEFAVSGPLSMYHFNRVEGHSMGLAFYLDDAFDKRLNGNLDLNYGFADKKFKKDLSLELFLGEYRTHSLSIELFDKTLDLFSESIYYNRLTSTLTHWFGKYDFRDYYYTKGFSFDFSSEIFPIMKITLGYLNRTDNTAYNNSNFSILNTSKNYRTNKPIFETKINAVTFGLKLDLRKYIEDGYYRRRISGTNNFPVLSLEAMFSDGENLKSKLDFKVYKLNLRGSFKTFKSAQLHYEFDGIYSSGAVPYQMLYALPGNIESAGKDFTFRTLGLGEVIGDRAYAVILQHNFRDELFRALGIPILKV